MKTTAAEFSRMLPTLQHVARFPTANRERLCARDGVTFVELEAMLFDLTDGSPSIWDEDCVAELATKFGVKLTPYDPAARPHLVASAVAVKPVAKAPASTPHTRAGDAEGALLTLKLTPSEARRRVDHAVAQLGQDATTEQLVKFAIKHPAPKAAAAPVKIAAKPAAAKPTIASKGNRLEIARERFRVIAAALLADETLAESKAVEAAGGSISGWHYFKQTKLGGTALNRKNLRIWLEVESAVKPAPVGSPRAADSIKPAKRSYTRRRLLQTTAAPAGAAANTQAGDMRVAAMPAGSPLVVPAAVAGGGKSLLGDFLFAQLLGGAASTHSLGNFRLELDLRLVPLNQGGPARD